MYTVSRKKGTTLLGIYTAIGESAKSLQISRCFSLADQRGVMDCIRLRVRNIARGSVLNMHHWTLTT